MTVYAKIEDNKLITAYNGYNGITGLADSPELCLENGFTAYTEEEVSGYFAGTHKIIDSILTDITNTPQYISTQRKKEIRQELLEADIIYNSFIDTPVQYTNGFYYKPKYVNDYVLMVASGLSYEIWDASELHSGIMTALQIRDLALFLKLKAEPEFQSRKEKRRLLLQELAELG